jgi:hypothetical protein
MTRNVDAALIASPAFGVPQKMLETMPDNCGEWLTTAFDGSKARRKQMNEYEFTLKFQLADAQIDPDQYVDKLYINGCDDALVGIGRKGQVSLQFIREANSASLAVMSALSDVHRAIPEAKLIEASPDYAGVSEVAQLLRCTRQNMRVLIERASDAPPPVHEGTSSLWHLIDLLTWLKDSKAYTISPALLEMAQLTRLLNSVRSIEALRTMDVSRLDTAQLEMVAQLVSSATKSLSPLAVLTSDSTEVTPCENLPTTAGR